MNTVDEYPHHPVPRGLAEMTDLDHIRAEIDTIDREIVALVARRTERVRRLLEHKHSPDAIRVPAREREVLANVRSVAEKTGADPDLVERVYETMIAAFVEYEQREQRRIADRNAG
ncbi:MAG TPA: chorismate mutase [Conexibacter sp.]|nr:chorismate mutase [Conexibacter sp.]